MAHHRCTRCKQESYPRHKYYNGVFCESCMKIIRYGKEVARPNFWSRMWTRILDIVDKVIHTKTSKVELKLDQTRTYIRMKAMESRARRIPVNPNMLSPQKR